MASGQPPGQLALRAAMPPPPPRPRRPEVVLDEDEYTATLEAIIERDFFPELAKLESKVAWLQAVRSGDPEQIRRAQLAIAARRAAGGRPATGATPAGGPLFTPGGTAARAVAGDTPYIPVLPPGTRLRRPQPGTGATAAGSGSDGEGGEAGPVAPPPESLDGFLAAHTSEDNASFQELLEHVNKRRRLKAAALAAPHADPRALADAGRERTDGFGTTGQPTDTLIGWRYEPLNALYYDGAARAALPLSEAELAAQAQGPAKAINHGATRFPRGLAPSASATPTASSGGAPSSSGPAGGAIAGAGRAAAAVGPGTRGYGVLATPVFEPGADESPFMTWGDIEATPLRIEAEDLPLGGGGGEGPTFFIKEGSRKEQAAQQLASKAGASLARRGASRRGATPLVAGRQRLGSGAPASGRGGVPGTAKPLSAAARRLASSMHRGLGGADMGLRASYRGATPSTGRRPAASAGGSSWSARPTPSRGQTPSAATPAPARLTLEEEEARVRAVMQRRHKEAAQRAELDAAREAAQAAFDPQRLKPAPTRPAAEPAAAGADLTAGLLNI